MSSEQTINKPQEKILNINSTDFLQDEAAIKYSKRVNINNLLLRIKKERTKQKKTNIIFCCTITSIILATGLIASL